MTPFTFTDKDFHVIDLEQDDPWVITIYFFNYAVKKKKLVNHESSVNILYLKMFGS